MLHAGAERERFDIFARCEQAEGDVRVFVFGVICGVGGFGVIGYRASLVVDKIAVR